MEKILSIVGRSGLYRMVNQGKNLLVVESIDSSHRRMPAFSTDKIINLSEVAIYAKNNEVPLWQVLMIVGEREKFGKCSLDYKKCTSQELHRYFAEVLPSYDHNRVHDSDIRRLVQWYNILVEGGYTDFEDLLSIKEV